MLASNASMCEYYEPREKIMNEELHDKFVSAAIVLVAVLVVASGLAAMVIWGPK
jgi:hypothetical protein